MTPETIQHLKDRFSILSALREELVGPRLNGLPLESASFPTWDASGFAWLDPITKEEVVSRNTPTFWYKVGVLFPPGATEEPAENSPSSALTANTQARAESEAQKELNEATKEIDERSDGRAVEGSDESIAGAVDFDDALRSANERRPTSMGLSFTASIPKGGKLVVRMPKNAPIARSDVGLDSLLEWKVNGRYRQFSVEIAGKQKRIWWRRESTEIVAEFLHDDLFRDKVVDVVTKGEQTNLDGFDLEIACRSRRHEDDQDRRRITICVQNKSSGGGSATSLFQAYFYVKILDAHGNFVGFSPSKDDSFLRDEESEELALMYRDARTYASGHGCAADWHWDAGIRAVSMVSAEIMPIFETPNTSPVLLVEGKPLEIDMAVLAGTRNGDPFAVLEDLARRYETWIADQEKEAAKLNAEQHDVGARLTGRAVDCVKRIQEGIALLRESRSRNGSEWKSFQLANRAMIIQQQCSKKPLRNWEKLGRNYRLAGAYVAPDEAPTDEKLGKWRPFQIAFILSALVSTGDESAPDRELVDLIWFPTGGGKTEAYLGLAAYTMFLRRLQNTGDQGTHVIMRYTLRLLTAQQFQRACSLICAMEALRRTECSEIKNEFSIGLWLGRDNTPNKRNDAVKHLRRLQGDVRPGPNPFILEKCPWSGARIGRVEKGFVPGYEELNSSVAFECPDAAAGPFAKQFLPIYVIDEDIFDNKPTLLIGTVDKFATLPWQPRARAIFGLAEDGTRKSAPPGLIIQDELHLISGPLGTMVGAYETVLEDFCSDKARPKIVCSTATIRRSSQQILHLFGRERSAIFPPPGLSAEDSFFACREKLDNGKNAPGRMYVGVSAPALGSALTVQTRAFTALLQHAYTKLPETPKSRRDPWWTLLIFFNSIRELGGACTLFQSDIPAWTRTWQARHLVKHVGADIDPKRRFVRNVKELTSRLKNHEIPQAIAELERPFEIGERKTVDVCLASNIIEVGIDVQRLGLMAIVGQPKNTAQYIQVSGRVGREVGKPGMVVALYSPTKSRDRSHYEHFRSYHERLYAQVEPTSVTPFSTPTLERALHGLIATYVRMKGSLLRGGPAAKPSPVPEDLLESLKSLISRRMDRLKCEERAKRVFDRIFERRRIQWRNWASAKEEWVTPSGGNKPLLHAAGSTLEDENELQSWATPMSMRSVDADCRLGQLTNARIDKAAAEEVVES